MQRNIRDGISWVGAFNPDLRVFDVIMETKWGTTYNSYLVQGSTKTALIDAVKLNYSGDLTKNIDEHISLDKIDYIIVNHTEPDHSGAIVDIIKKADNAVIVGSRTAISFLKEIVNEDFDSMVVKDGDEIDLGEKKLKFINAPFLHWPDSMFTYVEKDKVIFTGDVFGCHFCSEDYSIYSDEINEDILPAQKYYFDVIMSPFKKYVLEALDKIKDLEIEAICPSHGPIFRENPQIIMNSYKEWSGDILNVNNPKRIFIGYVSAYGNTRMIGEAIIEGIKEVGDFDVDFVDVSTVDISEVINMIDSADGILLGSPTVNRDALLPVWNVLIHMSMFKNAKKPAASFGSYGWSGEAVTMIENRLKSIGLNIIETGFKTKLVPNEKALKDANQFGKNYALNFIK